MVYITLTSICTITLIRAPHLLLIHKDIFFNKTKSNMYSRGHTFLWTAKANKKYYTLSKNKDADNDRDLQGRIWWFSVRNYIRYINGGQLVECNTTIDHIYAGEVIYDPLKPILLGKNGTTHTTTFGKRHLHSYSITGVISTPNRYHINIFFRSKDNHIFSWEPECLNYLA